MVPRALAAVDGLLLKFAVPFGATVRHDGLRYSVLLGVYGTLYVAISWSIPVLDLALLAIGFGGVIAMGRAWSANERMRASIAKKLADGNPDALPDLRGAYLFCSLQLGVLFPLLFRSLQESFHLYRVPTDTTLVTWLAFTFDSICKLFINFGEIYDVSFTRIEFNSPWGRHLVLLKRLTFEYMLIRAVLRMWDIKCKVREAVAAVRLDADLAVRVGRRAVRSLLPLLNDPDPVMRRQASRALGQIHDGSAIPSLRPLLADEDKAVRDAAAQALGNLGDLQAVEPLMAILEKEHSEKIVLFHDRRQAAEALGNLGDPRAVPTLTRLLATGEGDALVSVQRALVQIQRADTVATSK